jgi:hypothetical protein
MPILRRKYLLLIILAILLFITGAALYLRTPLFFRHLTYLLEYKYGFSVHADNVAYTPFMKAKISNLQVANTGKDGFQFVSKDVNVESKFSAAIKGEVEKIILNEPKIQIRIGEKKETETDLSFIKKIPPVHLLNIRKGEFKLIFGAADYELKFKEIDLDVVKFSPENGGNVTFQGLIEITGKETSDMTAHGQCKGSINLTGLFPNTIGTGLLEISLNSGVFKTTSLENVKLYVAVKFEKERIAVTRIDISAGSLILKNTAANKSKIKNSLLKTSMIYELKPKTLIVDRFLCEIPSLGSLSGYYRGSMKDTFPWKAGIDATDIDFKTIFAYLKPFIEKSGDDKWSIQGKGMLKSEMEGTFKGRDPAFSGKAVLQFRKGGFSSADGTKAAQGMEGSMVLKFSIPLESQKTSINMHTELFPGEYLFDAYYKDFTKDRIKISSDMDISFSSKQQFDFKGTLNLFDTGQYMYTGSIGKNKRDFSFIGKDISNQRLLSVLFYDYLQQNYPLLKNMDITGKLNTALRVEAEGEKYSFNGNIRADTTSVSIPEKSLKVSNISIDLPFKLSNPSVAPLSEEQSVPGKIFIERLERGTLEMTGINIPITSSDNGFAVSENFEIPLYGGKLRILQCATLDILSPSRKFYFAAKIENLDFGAMLNDLTGMQLPGSMEAHFPMIAHEDGKWVTKGVTEFKVFGGTIEANNVHAKNIFSSSRTIGGDIIFSDIDLGKITDTIKIGKIKGVIHGSIKGLEIEYGQPSYFILDIDSVKKKGVEQTISVDAIENISIIGTGSGAVGAILRSGINRFFKEYPYSRIGIKCTLENDNFRLNGKIHEGGNEYFIRKSFLRGLDVINRDPDNTVSFDDMQERVGRIFKKDGNKPTFTTSMN